MNTQPLYYFDKDTHEPKVFAYCLQKAKENKLWAENKNTELNGKEWKEASEVSKQMLNKWLTTDTETMAIDTYKYLRLRSHSFGSTTMFPIDKTAYDLWTKLTGTEPQNTQL